MGVFFGTEESHRLGAISVGVKYDTNIFLRFYIFVLEKA